jgi:NAD-dependent deacetylase
VGREPNAAHLALAEMEVSRRIAGIVTQNIDGLHQRAGSRKVLEIHGEATRLQCLSCNRLVPIRPVDLEPGPAPRCSECGAPLKPNIVLFEEPVREILAIRALLDGCDLLLVVGTSAQVAPASGLPLRVLEEGGSLVEFNVEETQLTRRGLGPEGTFVLGPVGKSLPLVARELLQIPSAGSGS